MERALFEQFYAGQAPWDIGRPQPAVQRLAEAGEIRGSVLDVGCGTGDNALFLASRGHETWGLDYVSVAIDRARAKAAERGLDVRFLVGDALELHRLGRQFDTVIDCGLFHTFSDEERPRFVRELAGVLRASGLLHILCFSEEEPGNEGPRRVSRQELGEAFARGWTLVRIEPIRFATNEQVGPAFSPGGPKAWLATFQRTADAIG